MSRKRCNRRVITPQAPRALRPRLLPDQVRDLALAHNVNLGLIASGEADREVLFHFVGGVLLWQLIADALGRRTPARGRHREGVTHERA